MMHLEFDMNPDSLSTLSSANLSVTCNRHTLLVVSHTSLFSLISLLKLRSHDRVVHRSSCKNNRPAFRCTSYVVKQNPKCRAHRFNVQLTRDSNQLNQSAKTAHRRIVDRFIHDTSLDRFHLFFFGVARRVEMVMHAT